MNKNKKRMKRWVRNTITIISIILFFIVVCIIAFTILLKPVGTSSDDIKFIINKGDSKQEIVNSLKKKDLIKSKFATYLYLYLNPKTVIMDGTYYLNKNMSTRDIIYNFSSGKSEENKGITITFIEGKRITTYAAKIADVFPYNYDDIIKKLNDKAYLKTLVNKYSFLSDEILNNDIYYPLEGYLYPDTYTFSANASIENMIEKMLDNFENHYNKFTNNTNYSTHQIITLASIVELEGNDDLSRKKIAGVFYNRLNNNMSLGSDITSYYGVQKKLTDAITVAELNDNNAYNTRVPTKKGLPVGPVCNVSSSSIEAVLNPDKNDYYYFYADKNKKIYFAKTYDEHIKIVKEHK